MASMVARAVMLSESLLCSNAPQSSACRRRNSNVVTDVLANEILGTMFDYVFLPAVGVSGGILLGWNKEYGSAADVTRGDFSLTARLIPVESSTHWWITVVYGPLRDVERVQFLEELSRCSDTCLGSWLICGDFNMIYQAQDKNNDRLDFRAMRRFRAFINTAHLQEVLLLGRRFTWTSERERPTPERLDRCLATVDWFQNFPYHCLKPLSSDCSDHCPLLLLLDSALGAKRRFRFESFWTKLPGFLDVVAVAWSHPVHGDVDPFRVLDIKLRYTARALRSWSTSRIGSVRFQLALAREVVLRFDEAQDFRDLSPQEVALRKAFKLRSLGLASLARTVARQRSRLLFLAEGDANTKFFNLQACHRKRKNKIESLSVDGVQLMSDEAMAFSLFEHYNLILGSSFVRSCRINLGTIGLPVAELSGLEALFTEDEVRAVVMDLPPDKAPGPDGFTGIFFKKAWEIIKGDFMNAFHAFWSQDYRSLQHINDAYMVLLKKKPLPSEIRDYRPISLIHSFSKLITKCLANRLASVLSGLVRNNQSAFIKGRCIHDNFRAVRLSCKELHLKRAPKVLMKIDIAKAFDSVSWTFLLEVLQHMGFGRRWRNWISAVLSTASTKILLNGSPGRRICHARGLRQGDPLSPLLFVLVMEVINRAFCWLDSEGYFEPLSNAGMVQRVSLYADDLVLFVSPSERDLSVLKLVLQVFGESSGLFSNMDKSVATPIHCSAADLDRIQSILTCRIQNFPSRYLGIPLSIFRLKKCDEQALIDAVASRLPLWKGNLLTLQAERHWFEAHFQRFQCTCQ